MPDGTFQLPRPKRSTPTPCAQCLRAPTCWPGGHAGPVRVRRLPPLKRGGLLWSQGDPFVGLHVVSQGSLRITEITREGVEPLLLRRVAADLHRTLQRNPPAHDALSAVARFLEDTAARIGRDDQGDRVLRLPMTRADIARYLGLAEETVSRAFRQLAADGRFVLRGRELRWTGSGQVHQGTFSPV